VREVIRADRPVPTDPLQSDRFVITKRTDKDPPVRSPPWLFVAVARRLIYGGCREMSGMAARAAINHASPF